MMRHHQLPSRLIEWTQSFSVALYFAVCKCTSNGAIWILDPYRLNKKTIGNEAILHPQTDLRFGYYEYFIEESRKFPGRAMAILPNKTTARILAQRGVFTIHRVRNETLDSVCPKALKKIVLANDALKEAANFLKLAGVNEFTLYPDLDGLARWLRVAHGIDAARPRKPRTRTRRKKF